MDEKLLVHLMESHGRGLVLYARQWCRTPEDVVQEAFIKLASQRPLPDQPVHWLYRVVRNAAISAFRSAKRHRQREADAAQHRTAWFEPDQQGHLDAGEVTRALQTLPLLDREILITHLWGGLTFAQIGEMTGCSSSTAHRRYMQGLAALRERLNVPCPTPTNEES